MNDEESGINSVNINFDSHNPLNVPGSLKLKRAVPKISSISYSNTEDSSKLPGYTRIPFTMKNKMTPMFAKLVLSPPNSNKNLNNLKKSKLVKQNLLQNIVVSQLESENVWNKLFITTKSSKSPNKSIKLSKVATVISNDIKKILSPPKEMRIEEEVDSNAHRGRPHQDFRHHFQTAIIKENNMLQNTSQLADVCRPARFVRRSRNNSKWTVDKNMINQLSTAKSQQPKMPEILEKIDTKAFWNEYNIRLHGADQFAPSKSNQSENPIRSSNNLPDQPFKKVPNTSEFYSTVHQNNKKFVDFPYMPRKTKKKKPFFICCGV